MTQLHKHRIPQKGLFAISKDDDNSSFTISSMSLEAIRSVTEAFAPSSMRHHAKVKVLILLHPHHLCAGDEAGRCISNSNDMSIALDSSRRTFSALVWSTTMQEIIRGRMIHRPVMQVMYKSTMHGQDIEVLRTKLGDELIQHENTKMELEKVRLLLEGERKQLKHLESKKKLLEASVSKMHHGLCAIRDEFQHMRRATTKLLTLHSTEIKAVDTTLLAQLVRVAVQCAHYFRFDRFSSAHMRRSLITSEEGVEGISFATLLLFPRMRDMCVGDSTMLRTACALLDDVRIDKDTVWFVGHSVK